MKISVITVCYNSEKTIRKTIESVLSQTYQDFEYILIDGASKDDTVSVIKEYEPKFTGRMKWVSEPDKGIYDAMNKGIRMATGELIGIINSDDYYEQDALLHMSRAMTDEKYQILYGFMRTLKNGEEYTISLRSHKALREGMIAHPSCFVSKSVYDDFGSYDTKYISAADYDFMLRMSENKKVHFYPVYHLIANFSAGGMCSTVAAYLDLLKMKRDHGLISEREYRKLLFKDKVYRRLHGIRK